MWDIIKVHQGREPVIYCPCRQLCLPLQRPSAVLPMSRILPLQTFYYSLLCSLPSCVLNTTLVYHPTASRCSLILPWVSSLDPSLWPSTQASWTALRTKWGSNFYCWCHCHKLLCDPAMHPPCPLLRHADKQQLVHAPHRTWVSPTQLVTLDHSSTFPVIVSRSGEIPGNSWKEKLGFPKGGVCFPW